MGRVSIETQITRESIGKIDNQMSSGIELKLVKIISAMRESIDTDLMNRVAFK